MRTDIDWSIPEGCVPDSRLVTGRYAKSLRWVGGAASPADARPVNGPLVTVVG
jgi:hypothetical protein